MQGLGRDVGGGDLLVGGYVGYMDTDMAADVPADQKVAAADIATQALHGIETGLPEILADETSRYVKQGLSAAPRPNAG